MRGERRWGTIGASNRLFMIMSYVRCNGRERGAKVTIEVDGRPLTAFAGETVATALLAAGLPALRVTRSGAPRSAYCGMGVCWECVLTIDGAPNQRACDVGIRDGMRVAMGSAPTSKVGRADDVA